MYIFKIVSLIQYYDNKVSEKFHLEKVEGEVFDTYPLKPRRPFTQNPKVF